MVTVNWNALTVGSGIKRPLPNASALRSHPEDILTVDQHVDPGPLA
jgi:hypothetical protein